MKFLTLEAYVDHQPAADDELSPSPIPEAWFVIERASGPAEMDRMLSRPEFFGWIHQPGMSSEAREVVVERARKNPGRCAVIVCSQSSEASKFVLDVGAQHADLFTVLPRYELPGSQLLGAMQHRAPYSFGARILSDRIPSFGIVDKDHASLKLAALQLFVAMPFGARESALSWRSAQLKEQCAGLLRANGLKSETKVCQALFALSVCYYVRERQQRFGDAVAMSGGRDKTHAAEVVQRVLLLRSLTDLTVLLLEEAVGRVERFITLGSQKVESRLLVAPNTSSGTAWAGLAEPFVVPVHAEAAPSGAWLDAELIGRVMANLGPFAEQIVLRRLPRGGGAGDALALVFELVSQKWAKHQVLDSAMGRYELKMHPDFQRASLRRICGNVIRNEERRNRLRDSVLTSLQDLDSEDPSYTKLQADPLGELEAEELNSRFARSIADMPPSLAKVARAKFGEGLTNEEIAQRYHWTLEYVEARVSVVRRAFREVVSKYESE